MLLFEHGRVDPLTEVDVRFGQKLDEAARPRPLARMQRLGIPPRARLPCVKVHQDVDEQVIAVAGHGREGRPHAHRRNGFPDGFSDAERFLHAGPSGVEVAMCPLPASQVLECDGFKRARLGGPHQREGLPEPFQALRSLAHFEMGPTDVAQDHGLAAPVLACAKQVQGELEVLERATRPVDDEAGEPHIVQRERLEYLIADLPQDDQGEVELPQCRSRLASPEEDVPDFVLRDPLLAAILGGPEKGQRDAEVGERAVRLAEGQALDGAVLEVCRLAMPGTGGAGQFQCFREPGNGLRELSEVATSDRDIVQRLRLTEEIAIGAPERQRLFEVLEA